MGKNGKKCGKPREKWRKTMEKPGHLVGGLNLTPLKNMSSSIGMRTSPIYGKKHVPNHQPCIWGLKPRNMMEICNEGNLELWKVRLNSNPFCWMDGGGFPKIWGLKPGSMERWKINPFRSRTGWMKPRNNDGTSMSK